MFSNHIALSIAYSAHVAGREPAAEDMEPMSWAIYSMIQKLGAVQGMAAAVQLQAHSRRLVAFLSPYDALLTPALAERPLPLGTLEHGRARTDVHIHPLGPVHAVHPRVQRQRSARHLAAAV